MGFDIINFTLGTANVMDSDNIDLSDTNIGYTEITVFELFKRIYCWMIFLYEAIHIDPHIYHI